MGIPLEFGAVMFYTTSLLFFAAAIEWAVLGMVKCNDNVMRILRVSHYTGEGTGEGGDDARQLWDEYSAVNPSRSTRLSDIEEKIEMDMMS